MFKVRISWNIKKISALTMSAILLFNMIPGIILFVFADDAEEVLQTVQEELDKESANVEESELTDEPLPVQEGPNIEKEVVYNNVASEGAIDTDWYNSEAELFEISSKEEFKGLAKLVNEGNSFLGKTIKLTDDIDINGEELVPIGTSENPFKGIFEGDYNTIYNFSINGTSTDNQGLFGYISEGTIKNLFLSNFKVVATEGIDNIGGIVGYAAQQSAIVNCKVESSGEIQSYGEYTGGIVGYLEDSVINECLSNVTISGLDYTGGVVGYAKNSYISNCSRFLGTVTGEDMVGGIIGRVYYGTVISDCINEGAVTGNDKVGGMVGYADRCAVISNCTNEGTVSGGNYVGGIIGYEYECLGIIYCTNEGEVRGRDYVGGIIGYAHNLYSIVVVIDCTNEGAVSGASNNVGGIVGYAHSVEVIGFTNYGTVSGSNEVGGIIDEVCDVEVIGCTNYGTVSGSNEVGGIIGEVCVGKVVGCTNYGTVSGSNEVGGIIGEVCVGKVVGCTNYGTVTGSNKVGGIVGENYYTDINNAKNFGDIEGGYQVGGIVGYGYVGQILAQSRVFKIEGCINYGNVKGTDTPAADTDNNEENEYTSVGGIVGRGKNIYVNECTNYGIIEGTRSVGGVAGYTTDSSIEYCNNGDSTYKNVTNVIGKDEIGGIVGTFGGTKGNESLNYLKYNSNYANISGSTEVGQIYGWRSKYSNEENNHEYANVSIVNVASIQEQVPYAEMSNPDPVVSTLSGTALAPVTLKSLNKEIPDVQKAVESAEKINATDNSNTETIVLEEEEKGFFERIWAWILDNIDKVKEFIKNSWNGCNFKYQISQVRV